MLISRGFRTSFGEGRGGFLAAIKTEETDGVA